MKRPIKHLGTFLPAILTVGDWIILNVAFVISFVFIKSATIDSKWILWLIVNIAFIYPSVKMCEAHDRRTIRYDTLMARSIYCSMISLAISLAGMYLFHINEPLTSIALFFVIFCSLLTFWSIVVRKIIRIARGHGLNYQKSIIVGCGKTARQLIQQLQGDPGYGIRVTGVFADDEVKINTNILPIYKGNIKPMEDVELFAVAEEVNIVYYTMDGNDIEVLNKMMEVAEQIGAAFIYVPKLPKLMSAQFEEGKVGDMHVLEHKYSPLTHLRNRLLKRAFDLAISVPFSIVSPLIFIPIAIGIKISSPGPIFFRQKRTGLFGSEFTCLKFRTMRVNADSDKVQATKDDPRKTKFGDFLRRTSLDELPQFFNVLWGDMTVVGPRPHMVNQTMEYRQLISKYMIRHAVKPGITGWAQINGFRGATEELWQMEKRVEHDVWYVSNWNIFLDIKIVFLTFFNQLKGEENAY